MIDVNLHGVPNGIAAVLPRFVHQGSGHVVNVASIGAHMVVPTGAVYCATKYAVWAITEGLRQEHDDVRATVISPGVVATKLGNDITDPQVADALKAWRRKSLTPDAIARAIHDVLELPQAPRRAAWALVEGAAGGRREACRDRHRALGHAARRLLPVVLSARGLRRGADGRGGARRRCRTGAGERVQPVPDGSRVHEVQCRPDGGAARLRSACPGHQAGDARRRIPLIALSAQIHRHHMNSARNGSRDPEPQRVCRRTPSLRASYQDRPVASDRLHGHTVRGHRDVASPTSHVLAERQGWAQCRTSGVARTRCLRLASSGWKAVRANSRPARRSRAPNSSSSEQRAPQRSTVSKREPEPSGPSRVRQLKESRHEEHSAHRSHRRGDHLRRRCPGSKCESLRRSCGLRVFSGQDRGPGTSRDPGPSSGAT